MPSGSPPSFTRKGSLMPNSQQPLEDLYLTRPILLLDKNRVIRVEKGKDPIGMAGTNSDPEGSY